MNGTKSSTARPLPRRIYALIVSIVALLLAFQASAQAQSSESIVVDKQVVSAEPYYVGEPITYDVTLTYTSTDPSLRLEHVALEDLLYADQNWELDSFAPTTLTDRVQFCRQADNTNTAPICQWGPLYPGDSVTMRVTTIPHEAGTFQNTGALAYHQTESTRNIDISQSSDTVFVEVVEPPPLTVEAEDFSKPSGTVVVSDAMYSGGQALKFTDGQAVATKQVTITETSTVVVRARAGQTGGSPTLTIRVDGQNVGTRRITSNVLADYPYAAIELEPGTYTIGLKGGDLAQGRNVYVDVLTFPSTS
jgi:hypothetical protein